MCEKCCSLSFICKAYLKCSETERPAASVLKRRDKHVSLADTIQNNKACIACNFRVMWLCHERHGMYFLCVNSCSLSCHTVIKQFVFELVKAYIYQAKF